MDGRHLGAERAHFGIDILALSGDGIRDFTAHAIEAGLDAFGELVVLGVEEVEVALDLGAEFGEAPVDAAAEFGEAPVEGGLGGDGRAGDGGGAAAGGAMAARARRVRSSISAIRWLSERCSGGAERMAARRAALRVRVTPTPNARPSPKATARVRQTDESRLLCI